MRTFLRIFFVIFSSLVFHSCDKEDTIISNEISEGNAIKKFANAKEFESYLNNVDLNRPSTRSANENEFSDAESTVEKSPEVMFMIPDERFRRVLNKNLEIIVADTIYKVTKDGTFYANIKDKKELEESIDNFSAFENVNESTRKLGNVFVKDTHSTWNNKEDNPITNPHFFDDPDDYLYTDDPDKDNYKLTTRSVHREITDSDLRSFPVIGVVKPNFVQKMLEFITNRTTYEKVRFKSNKNMKLYVSVYNKDHAFFRSTGVDVKVMKKLWYGGWGRRVHWDEGVYLGFSRFIVERKVTFSKGKEMKEFFDSERQKAFYNTNRNVYDKTNYGLISDGKAYYDSFPFRNSKGHRGFSVPYLIDFFKDEQIKKLNYFIVTKFRDLIKKGKEKNYSVQRPTEQYTLFNNLDYEIFHEVYENIFDHNGGGYRLEKNISLERKSFEFIFELGGKGPIPARLNKLQVGHKDIISSKIVAAYGYVYTIDGDGFIGFRITEDL